MKKIKLKNEKSKKKDEIISKSFNNTKIPERINIYENFLYIIIKKLKKSIIDLI